ncbi:gamma-butyrobetaine hydroxylase-like domain-containing protein [Planctomycetota bacterium]
MPGAIQPLGHYAVQIEWNDGHSTGIYAYDMLKKMIERGDGMRPLLF